VFLVFKWSRPAEEGNPVVGLLKQVRVWPLSRVWQDLSAERELSQYNVLLVLFSTNLIGMAFSRGTHQQFYAWYSYTFPFLVDEAFGPDGERPLTKIAVVLCLEIAWSVAKPRSPL